MSWGPMETIVALHIEIIRAATPADYSELLQHFLTRGNPPAHTPLHVERTQHVPEDEWTSSWEHEALALMLERCWPSELSQAQ